jgi:hypothetical protein
MLVPRFVSHLGSRVYSLLQVTDTPILLEQELVTPRKPVRVLYVFSLEPLNELFGPIPVGVDSRVS